MSVVIVGGNERMVCRYQDICKNHGLKAKVFPKENGALKRKLGRPDPPGTDSDHERSGEGEREWLRQREKY